MFGKTTRPQSVAREIADKLRARILEGQYQSGERLPAERALARQLGFLAQEVRAVLPEVVREDENGTLAVATSQLVPVLVEALQDLELRVAELEAENERLRR